MGRTAVLSIVVALCTLLTPGVAAAHGDRGVLEVYRLEVADASEGMLRLEVVVGVRYPEDGHPALDATIRLSGRNEAQVRLLPVTLGPTGEAGEYAGSTELVAEGGAWDLDLVSERPAATVGFRFDPASGEFSGVTVVDEAGHGHAHGDATEEPSPMRRRLVLIVIGCAAVAVVSAGLRRRERRRRETPPPDPS